MLNKYEVRGNHVAVFVECKDRIQYETLIDLSDLERVKSIEGHWRATGKERERIYVYANDIALHRLVTAAPAGLVVDHINHVTLDNRKRNLRCVTVQENVHNTNGVKSSRTGSGLRNVYRHRSGRWQAKVMLNGKSHSLGLFGDKYDAVEAVKAFKKSNGLFFYDPA